MRAKIPSNKKENLWLNEIHPQPPQPPREFQLGDAVNIVDASGDVIETLRVIEIGEPEEIRRELSGINDLVIVLRRYTLGLVIPTRE